MKRDPSAPGNTPDPAYSSFSLAMQNSIFTRVASLGSDGATLAGNTNGFYNSPTFGTAPIAESDWPFAAFAGLANAQGWYYLRDGSPFLSAGWPSINSS